MAGTVWKDGYRYKANYTQGTSTSGSNTAFYWSDWWYYVINVTRSSPERPTLVDDGTGTISGNTKTMYFDGTPGKIVFTPDYGSGLLTWREPTGKVIIFDRAIHGIKKNLTLQVAAAGTYTITLTTPSNRWKDGSSGAVVFTFILKIQTTTKPQLKKEDGVASNGLSKYVNDTGGNQTITFIGADKNFLAWDSNGLMQASWTDDGELTLYQSKQNVYTINIYIANTLGCTWDDGSITRLSFTFTIGPVEIERPTIEGLDGALTKRVTYNGEAQSLVLLPVTQGQMMVLAPGIPYTYSDGKVAFTSTNATDATGFTIRVSPSEGYVWRDTRTQEQIVFHFIIDTVKLTAPQLLEDNITNYTKRVVYDPTPGSTQTLTIGNVRREAVSFVSAMSEASWEEDTLVLSASEARTYYVSFEPKLNYEWAPGQTIATFVLVVERYTLGTPYLVISEEEKELMKLPADSKNKILIEGNTKTVNYETDEAQKYINLYVGGVNGQLTCVIEKSNAGVLTESWNDETNILTLRGVAADNYLIKITPTSNYKRTARSSLKTSSLLFCLYIQTRFRCTYKTRPAEAPAGIWRAATRARCSTTAPKRNSV